MDRSPNILIANHHTAQLPPVITALRQRGFVVLTTTHLKQTLDSLRRRRYDVVVLAPLAQDVSGYEVTKVRELLGGEPAAPLLLILDNLESLESAEQEAPPFEDFVSRPVRERELLARIDIALRRLNEMVELSRSRDELRRQTITDFKTGLFNDRYFNRRLAEEFQRVRRYHFALSVMLIDFDNFKQINDGFDHVFGDFVLLAFAKKLRSLIRDIDIPARFGGDEFAIILPNTGLDHAVRVGHRIRSILSNVSFKRQDQETGVTVSIGIDSIAGFTDLSAEEFLRRADKALMEAKKRGRNRICLYQEVAGELPSGLGS